MAEEIKYPKVGIGVMIQNNEGKVLLGKRKNFHGAGEWSFPGGHLEFGEKIFDCARREAAEEIGLAVQDLELISVGDELRYWENDNKHYLNLGVKAVYQGGEPKAKEPEKCEGWRWFELNDLPDDLFEGTELIIRNFQVGKIYQE